MIFTNYQLSLNTAPHKIHKEPRSADALWEVWGRLHILPEGISPVHEKWIGPKARFQYGKYQKLECCRNNGGGRSQLVWITMTHCAGSCHLIQWGESILPEKKQALPKGSHRDKCGNSINLIWYREQCSNEGRKWLQNYSRINKDLLKYGLHLLKT